MEFAILGPLEVSDRGRPLPALGSKQRALLAVLLLYSNQVVSTDRLIDDLWPGEPPQSGVTALRVRVSQLRKSLGGAPFLETRPPGYMLRLAPDQLDLDRFERLSREATTAEPAAAADLLREALALWRGPPLADLEYESFAQPAIGRLLELRTAAIERRIDADLALGRHVEVVGELEELIEQYPLRERLRCQLVLALYRSSRQAEALAAIQAARRTLVDQLGLEPGPALRELERQILRQDRALELDAPGTAAADRAILVALVGGAPAAAPVALAGQLAREPPKEVIVVRLISGRDGLTAAATEADGLRSRIAEAGLTARAAAFSSRHPAEDVVRTAVAEDVDLVLLSAPSEPLADGDVTMVLERAPCDVALVVGGEARDGRVLVPFVGAEHDWTAIELGAWLALSSGAPLVIAGPTRGVAGRDASRLLASASLVVQRAHGVAAMPLLLEPGVDALVAAADDAAVVVVGLSDRWRSEGLGSTRRDLVRRTRSRIVLVRRGLRPGGLAPREALTRFTWSTRS